MLSATDTRLKVLRVVTRLNLGGPARQIRVLHNELPRHGVSSYILYGQLSKGEDSLFVPEAHADYIPTLRARISPISDIRATASIWNAIRKYRPHILHTHMSKAGALARFAALAVPRRKRPIIIHTYHGQVLDNYFPKLLSFIFLAIERFLGRHTDALVAITPSLQREIMQHHIGKRAHWDVVYGLPLEDIVTGSVRSQHALRHNLGIPSRHVLVTMPARLAAIKDHDTCLSVAAILTSQRPDIWFLIVGDGPRRKYLEDKTSRLERVILLGANTNVSTIYAYSDVVILTSRHEGAGAVLLEAAACRVPVVATAVGGIPDVVLDGVTGLLSPPGDAEHLAQHLTTLVEDPARRKKMGERAREHAVSEFSSDRLVEDTLRLYARFRPISVD